MAGSGDGVSKGGRLSASFLGLHASWLGRGVRMDYGMPSLGISREGEKYRKYGLSFWIAHGADIPLAYLETGKAVTVVQNRQAKSSGPCVMTFLRPFILSPHSGLSIARCVNCPGYQSDQVPGLHTAYHGLGYRMHPRRGVAPWHCGYCGGG